MALYPTPGETFRINASWTSSGVWTSGSGTTWVIAMNDVVATSANPNGWTVSVVSGSLSQSNLVVDVTAPVGFERPFTSLGQGYDAPLRFWHGKPDPSGTSLWQFVPFSNTTLENENSPRFGLAAHRAGFLVSAVSEPDGVHFYRINDAIAGKLETGILAGHTPSLWFDAQGALWCCLSAGGNPATASANWKLYRSMDYGGTWQETGTAPWDSTREVVVCNGGASNAILSLAKGQLIPGVSDNVGVHFRYSYDRGATWSEPVAVDTATAEAMYAVFQLGDGSIFANASDVAGFRLSRDWGFTWATPSGSPIFQRFIHIADGGTDAGGVQSLIAVGAHESTYAMKAFRQFGVSTNHVEVTSKIFDMSRNEGRNWFQIIKIPNSTTQVITNGRDTQFISLDMGRTWSNY